MGSGLTAALLYYAAQDVEGIVVAVEAPAEVTVGDTLELRVTVTNTRDGRSLQLSDIDISEMYLEGFSVLSILPEAKSSQHVPIDNSQSYKFNMTIAPLETRDFLFQLRAEHPGDYWGDIDVCEGLRFITAEVETSVLPPE
jgi:hypothetical protein